MSDCSHFGTSATPSEVIVSQVAASGDGRIIEKRGPSKGHITTMVRGSLPIYSVTLGKAKGVIVDT